MALPWLETPVPVSEVVQALLSATVAPWVVSYPYDRPVTRARLGALLRAADLFKG